MDVFLVIFLQKVHYLVPRLGMFPKQWKDSIFIWGIQAVYIIPTPINKQPPPAIKENEKNGIHSFIRVVFQSRVWGEMDM